MASPSRCDKCGLLHGAERRCFYDVLLDELEGVELTAYEDRIMRWAAGFDGPTVDVFVSIFRKLRGKGARRG